VQDADGEEGAQQPASEAERPRRLGRCSDADGPPQLKGVGEGEVIRVWRPLLSHFNYKWARLASNYDIVGDMS
jgi:hypothetical protein